MKARVLVIPLLLWSATPASLHSLEVGELLSDVVKTAGSISTLVSTYRGKREILAQLAQQFDIDYSARSSQPFEEFVHQQTITYMSFVEQVSKPLAAVLQIFYTLGKNLAPLDQHFKTMQEITEIAYNSARSLHDAAQVVKGNMEELVKKMTNPMYHVKPLSTHNPLALPIKL